MGKHSQLQQQTLSHPWGNSFPRDITVTDILPNENTLTALITPAPTCSGNQRADSKAQDEYVCEAACMYTCVCVTACDQ